MSGESKKEISMGSEDYKVRRQDWAVIFIGIMLLFVAKILA